MEEFTSRSPNLHLKHERELRRWTQHYVAEQLGVSLSSIRDWEEGFASPNSYYCEKLCMLYGKDAQALGLAEEMDGADEPYIPILESGPLPIIQGENLRLNNRRKRSNTFNTVIILLVLTLVLLPSLWFLGKNILPSTKISGPATPDTQPTALLSPTHFLHTPPSQKTKSPFLDKTPTGRGTPPTIGLGTVTPTGGTLPTTVPITATSTLQGGPPLPTMGPVTATSTIPGGGNLSPTTGPGGPTATPTTVLPTATPTSTFRTPDMSLVPPSLQPLGFTGWDYGTTKVILPPMRQIPAGPFKMGSDPNQDPAATTYDTGTQQPLQQFSLTLQAYQIGTYDVTVAEYALAVQAGVVPQPVSPSPASLGRDPVLTWQDQLLHPDYPVVNVSWLNTMAYTSWLAQITGISWRLPTEAEWEKAARGPNGLIYPYGDIWVQNNDNTDFRLGYLSPVGSQPDKSPYGVFDMSGNVIQWTSTIYRITSYTPNDGRENPNDTTSPRTQRGGSWDAPYVYGRCAYRGLGSYPGSYHPRVGFRLASW